MDKHVVTVTFRLQHLSRDHEKGDCYSVKFAPDVSEGEQPDAASEALMRQLLEITGCPLFCGNGEEPWGEGDPESETERRKQGPDRRPGTCRRFRFTYDALAALPPHPREHRAGQTEYRDAQVGGLCLSVGRTGLKHFFFRYSFRGKKRFLPLGAFPSVPLKEARNRVHEWRALLAHDLDPAIERARKRELPTLAEFAMQDYLPHAKAHKRSWLDDELRLKKAILPRFGALRLDMVTTREVQRFHTELASEKTPATANRYLALIRRMYSLANQWELYDGNPAKNVVRFPEHNARERYLSREEVARFLGALDEEENRPIAAGLKFLFRIPDRTHA